MQKIQEHVKYLRHEIDKHNYKYYVEDTPEISDRDFDKLLDELKQLEAQHPRTVVVWEGNSTCSLTGKTIVVTGTLENYQREEIEALIRRLGGKPAGSVSKSTSFVVAGDKAGSKLEKAKALGVEVITEEEFSKRIGK